MCVRYRYLERMTSEYFDPTATGLARAVTVAGGVSKMARAMSVSRQIMYMWLQRGYVPTGRAAEIEKLSQVPARELIDPKLRTLVER